MAFNAGAFAGALGQSALSTYERLNEQQLNAIKKAQLIQEMQEKQALDTAFRESQARVGQTDDYSQAIRTGGGAGTQQAKMLSDQGALPADTADARDFEKASAESAAGAMRENAVRQGAVPADKAALPTMSPTEYTKTQAMDEYVKRAGQVSRKGALEAIQLKSAVRASELEDKYDAEQKSLFEKLARVEGISESGGMEGLYKAGKKEGLKLNFVQGKNGIGSRIQVLGPNGDVLETISDINTAKAKLEGAAYNQFTSKISTLLGSPEKALAFIQQKQLLGFKEKEMGLKEKELNIKEPYYKSAAAENYAKANYYTAGGAAANRPVKKEVTNADIMSFVKEYGDAPSNEVDSKTGKALPIRSLPIAKQAAYASEFYLGRESGGGLPDIGKDGIGKPGKAKEAPATSSAIPRKFEGQVFGPLTSQSMIEEAARAGNPQAIEYLDKLRARRMQAEEETLRFGSGAVPI